MCNKVALEKLIIKLGNVLDEMIDYWNYLRIGTSDSSLPGVSIVLCLELAFMCKCVFLREKDTSID